MMRFMRLAIAIAMSAFPAIALADDQDLCTDRPGLGTPSCTAGKGRLIVEAGLADWTRDASEDAVTDTVVAGDMLIRFGLDDVTELHVGWTGYGHVRNRDRLSGAIERLSSTGDVTLGLRRGLAGPDGKIAVQPFVTLSTGGDAIGAGTWSAGVLVPFEFDLGKSVSLAFTPEIDAAADSDRAGRHLAYGSVIGLSAPLTAKLSATAEFQGWRNDDPDEHETALLGSLSFAYKANANLQFDMGGVMGLNSHSPDVELFVGVAERF